ncbi:hypothetical protein AB0D59_43925 [Streptomyces sp. NPDC048417]
MKAVEVTPSETFWPAVAEVMGSQTNTTTKAMRTYAQAGAPR